MGVRCPNCNLGLGWLRFPSLSTAWRCRCGVEVLHTASSFLEAWIRPLIAMGILGGSTALVAIVFHRTAAPPAHTELAALAFGAGLALSAVLVGILGPLSYPVGRFLGVPFSGGDWVRAGIVSLVLISCGPLAAWMLMGTIRSKVDIEWGGPWGKHSRLPAAQPR